MGNKPAKCIHHDDQHLTYYCPYCQTFGCEKCSHMLHAQTWPLNYAFKYWTADLEASLGVIRNCAYAFNNVADSIESMRDSLHELYYGYDRQIYYDAFEELVPYIKHQAVLLRHGLESITNYAMYMQNLLKNPPKANMQKVIDFWHHWKEAEYNAEITDDIQAFMLKLYDLNQIILSKEDANVIPTFKQIKVWVMRNSFYLMYKYATILCSVKDNENGFSWTVYVFMPAIKTILLYDNISPLLAYMLRILVHGTLYMCGNKPEMGPNDALLLVPLIKHETRITLNKKPVPYYIFRHVLAQVMSRFIIVTGGEISGVPNSKLLCYDLVSDKWSTFPGFCKATLNEVVKVFAERFLYVGGDGEHPYTIDLLDTESGWERAQPLPYKQNKHFEYKTKMGVKFGNRYDRKYMINGKCEVMLKGNVYKEEMPRKGVLQTYNSVARISKDNYYAVI